MTSSSRSNVDTTPLEERCEGLNINDVPIELDYIDVEDVAAYEKHEDNPQFCIISRVVTDRNIALRSFQNALGNSIRPMEELYWVGGTIVA
ncbi:hypothetical protein RND71_016625 [Anisodus tanguticus]|uniref:Uncharacterized protein n=1 Tax=Anisodus tanguticus TaxID=243964 RepID=A0AAE1S986_9SOLA|nr:hypothetical protein RND71_016625 [Anisodus tanguticus]